MSDAWRVSIQNRSSHSGKEIAEKYKESMQRSDEIVSGHELHLAMEFYEGVKLVEQHKK